MAIEWHDELPQRCPPTCAESPGDIIAFRAVRTLPPTEIDFKSQRIMFPRAAFNADECIARALSMSFHPAFCENLIKLPNREEKFVAAVRLNQASGLILKGRKTHFSWWRAKNYDPVASTLLPGSPA